MLSAIDFGEAGGEADVAGNDEGVGGNEQDVVERQRLPDDTHGVFSYAQKRIIPACCGRPESRGERPLAPGRGYARWPERIACHGVAPAQWRRHGPLGRRRFDGAHALDYLANVIKTRPLPHAARPHQCLEFRSPSPGARSRAAPPRFGRPRGRHAGARRSGGSRPVQVDRRQRPGHLFRPAASGQREGRNRQRGAGRTGFDSGRRQRHGEPGNGPQEA